MGKSTVQYRTMSPIEVKACQALAACTFLPGTPHKRFARDMGEQARAEQPLISEGQARWLWQLVYRYRRQISSRDLLAHAQAVRDGSEPFNLTA